MTARYSLGSRSVELELLGYEYEFHDWRPPDDDYGQNWLQVRAKLSDGLDSREVTAGLMLTWEVARLATWLDEVASGNFNQFPYSGIEGYPGFEIEKRPSQTTFMKVSLAWSPEYEEPLVVEFDADPLLLRAFASQLRSELQRFPIQLLRSDGVARREAAMVGRVFGTRADRHLRRWGR